MEQNCESYQDCPSSSVIQMQPQPHAYYSLSRGPISAAALVGYGPPAPVDYSRKPTIPFDKCPLLCSAITLLCPFAAICSGPALVCALLSYADYRVYDLANSKRKNGHARFLVITGCVFALLICIAVALIGLFGIPGYSPFKLPKLFG